MYVFQIYFKTENSTLFFQDMVKKSPTLDYRIIWVNNHQVKTSL